MRSTARWRQNIWMSSRVGRFSRPSRQTITAPREMQIGRRAARSPFEAVALSLGRRVNVTLQHFSMSDHLHHRVARPVSTARTAGEVMVPCLAVNSTGKLCAQCLYSCYKCRLPLLVGTCAIAIAAMWFLAVFSIGVSRSTSFATTVAWRRPIVSRRAPGIRAPPSTARPFGRHRR